MKAAGPLIIAAALLLAARARAEDTQDTPDATVADKPYATIVARNMFGLLPLPPPDTNPPAPPVDPPPKITPNGIMTIFGHLQALFKVTNKGKPGQPAKDDSYVLSEGERQDNIEVVKINEPDGLITFNNHGTIQELPLVPAANSTGPATGPGGKPGMERGNPAMGGFRPGMSPAERAAERAAAVRGRMEERGMNPGNPGNPGIGGNTGQPGLGTSNFQSQNNTQPQSIEDQVMNAAKEMAIIEQNRIATQEAVNQGLMPPLPPTMLTPPEATAFGGSPLIASPPEVPPGPAKK